MAARFGVRQRRFCMYSREKDRVFQAIETTRILLLDVVNNDFRNRDSGPATLAGAAGNSDEIAPESGHLERIN
jgi:hypothetical protein